MDLIKILDIIPGHPGKDQFHTWRDLHLEANLVKPLQSDTFQWDLQNKEFAITLS